MTKKIPLTLHDGTEVLIGRQDDEPDTLTPEEVAGFEDYMEKVKLLRANPERRVELGFLPD